MTSARRQIRAKRLLTLASFTLLLGVATLANAAPIYIESGGTTLYVINSTNGTSTLVGPYGVVGVLSQDFSPSGTLYAVFRGGNASLAQLATVDLQTGAATPIGLPVGVQIEAMAFTPDGTLYGANFDTNNLYTLTLTTGAATLVGPLGFANIMDMAWDPATHTMYAIESAAGCGGTASGLYSLNLAP